MAFKSELLRKKLKEAGKTRGFLAALTGVNERTVSRWLNDKNPPKNSDLEKIANGLGCTPHDFDSTFADEDQGGVAIHAHVSVASHNAYEMMKERYGANKKDIMELAPVLFSIVAGHALQVTEQDDALAMEAERLGFPSNGLIGSPEKANGLEIDKKASKDMKCFGLRPRNPSKAISRNLFHVAIQRLCQDIQGNVSAEHLAYTAPGEAPSAVGFIPDWDLLIKLTGEDSELAEALIKGRVRLSKCLEDHKASSDRSVGSFIRVLRKELARVDNQYNKEISENRDEGLLKLEAWRAYYANRYPDLAQEYDQIVENHCHEDGWYPSYYDEELQQLCWIEPYREDRHINEETLPEYQAKKAEFPKGFHLPMTDPIYQRFEQLEAHRRKAKAEFEGGGQ